MSFTIVILIVFLTALAVYRWPGETAAVLITCAPIVWGLGAAEAKDTPTVSLNIPMAISGTATLMYARYMFRRQRTRAFGLLQTGVIVYCLSILPTVAVASFSLQSIAGYMRLVSPVVIMFALVHESRPFGIHAYHYKAFALAALPFLAMVAAAQLLGQGLYLEPTGVYRLKAFRLTFQNISLYSVAVAGVLGCGLLLGRHRSLYAIGALGVIACTALAGFRTGWLGVVFLASVLLYFRRRSRFAKVAALLLVIAVIAQRQVVLQSIWRGTNLDNAGVSVDTLNAVSSGRISTDSIALDRYANGTLLEWVFGIGVGGAGQVVLRKEGASYGVHDDYLATLVECGVVGLAGYLFLLFVIGRLLFRIRPYLPPQHPAFTFVTVGLALFITFTFMGIAAALYTNVFVGWYYYGFLGFVFAQLKSFAASNAPVAAKEQTSFGLPVEAMPRPAI